ncbi:hypothetical protein PVK06_047543 [Gossypium arboreum]|uniref:RNase H type-1 domain-containing protein n=1 Tax=Gossypium arboreum TaxID=29729 RepID=A0ABR0MDL5_GOSAR|nr:hypothetical protein PVK06_047543 [Gossypium arboreum]
MLPSFTCRKIVCAVWSLWSIRNKWAHTKTFISPRQILRQTIDFLNEIDEIAKNLPVTKVGCERCRPPEVPFIKINFDAAFQATTSISYSRIIVRDGRSRILSIRASPFAAEALACLQSLKVGRDQGLREVMEGDSLSVIKKARSENLDRSSIGPYILDIKNEAGKFKEVRFTYVSRSANKSAHSLAKEGFRREDDWGLDQDTLELFVARENRNSFTYAGEEDVEVTG